MENLQTIINLRLIQVIKIWVTFGAGSLSPLLPTVTFKNDSTLQSIKLKFRGEKTGLAATTEDIFKY